MRRCGALSHFMRGFCEYFPVFRFPGMSRETFLYLLETRELRYEPRSPLLLSSRDSTNQHTKHEGSGTELGQQPQQSPSPPAPPPLLCPHDSHDLHGIYLLKSESTGVVFAIEGNTIHRKCPRVVILINTAVCKYVVDVETASPCRLEPASRYGRCVCCVLLCTRQGSG